LLSNAAKFTKNGLVRVTVSKAGDWGVIAVRDSGIGMSKEQMTTVFETFSTCENETTSSYGDDLGLGLPLTQRLCRLMGGDLTVESKLGHGSCFTIRVPPRQEPESGELALVA
jgi:signal transduction histidine kinase